MLLVPGGALARGTSGDRAPPGESRLDDGKRETVSPRTAEAEMDLLRLLLGIRVGLLGLRIGAMAG